MRRQEREARATRLACVDVDFVLSMLFTNVIHTRIVKLVWVSIYGILKGARRGVSGKEW